MKLLREIIDVFASIPARARVWLAEVGPGVTLIEAVKADAFESQLRVLTAGEDEREALRHLTLDIAKLGIPADVFAEGLMDFARASLRLDGPTENGES